MTAHPLHGRRVVLGVAGGIAAYKAVELLRLLGKAGADVQVVMTEKAREFVGAITFQTLSGKPVFTDMFSLTQESGIGHIQAADGADLVIIAPATANTIARIAAGLANDPLSAVVLATTAPVLLAPSMNMNMWQNPITQGNLQRLIGDRGARTVGPGSGFLACQWVGPGRLAEPAHILEAAARVLTGQDMAGRTVLVSAGPTREALDPVRFLSNRSTGRMGYALARAASRRGAAVRLVSGPASIEAPIGVEVDRVVDAAQMDGAVRAASVGADVVIMAAAPADFRPATVAPSKIKKTEPGAGAGLELEATVDILASLGRERGGASRPILVGFAAETDALIEHAMQKLQRKRCDLIVANDVSQPDSGFEVDTNRVTLVSADAEESLELATKDEIAHAILSRVVRLLGD